MLDSAARKLTFKSTEYDIKAPAAQQYYGILDFRDKNDNQIGMIDVFTVNATDERARIGCKNAAGNWCVLQTRWKDGVATALAPTPPAYVTGEEITTAGWFNFKMQVVSTLPANPDPNVFYFIPE